MPTARPRPVALALALALALAAAALLGACGGGGGGTSASSTTAAPTTSPQQAAEQATAEAWAADAQMYRGKDGQTLEYRCPAGGVPNDIWGVETYTDNSSVCTAAVHVGLITFTGGGTVTIEIGPGQAHYEAGSRNQVVSKRYTAWSGSFTFPESPPGSHSFQTPPDSWQVTMVDLELNGGDTAEVACSADGEPAKVWGTDVYTADSSICTAAVYEGRLTTASGGRVTIRALAGQRTYQGGEAHDITTRDHGRAKASFTFVDDAVDGTTTTTVG
jgi:hypothetical protein